MDTIDKFEVVQDKNARRTNKQMKKKKIRNNKRTERNSVRQKHDKKQKNRVQQDRDDKADSLFVHINTQSEEVSENRGSRVRNDSKLSVTSFIIIIIFLYLIHAQKNSPSGPSHTKRQQKS